MLPLHCAEHSACTPWETQRAAGYIGITDFAHGKEMHRPCPVGRGTGTAQPGWSLPTATRLAASHSPGDSLATSLGILQTAVERTGLDVSSNRTARKLAHTWHEFPQVYLTFVTDRHPPHNCRQNGGRSFPGAFKKFLSIFRDHSSPVPAQAMHMFTHTQPPWEQQDP